ncbi:hypothetical protein CVO76_15015, partial [Arthrobacter agilis]
KAINAGLHGFDVTWGPLDYPYVGDGNLAAPRSANVKFFQCEAFGFGDDAFTTHSADDVSFTECFGHSPRLRDNCNAFEIDGDSRRATLTANRSKNCYSGIEIKGHGNESAAQDVIINGHRDEGSVRSFNFRHIDYHQPTAPLSKTAKNIVATNLVSINPNNDQGFQDEASPRALCISAYHGVSIAGLTAIGRGGYAAGTVAVAIQFKSGHINLSGLNISGWTGADQDVSITSGDKVNVSGLTCVGSAARAVYTGSTVTAVNITGVTATAPGAGAAYGMDLHTSAGVRVSGIAVTGYPTPFRADAVNYLSMDAFARRTEEIPEGVTKLADLDTTKDYYASTTGFATFTDRPAGQGGGNWITHSRINSTSTIQTVTRNSSGATLQTQHWRILDYTSKVVGPWNRTNIGDLVPISGVLAAGVTTPPAGAAPGSVWLLNSAVAIAA